MYDTEEILPPGRLPTMQIIATALLFGVLTFLGIVLYIVHLQHDGHGVAPPRDLPILSIMAVAMLVINGVLAFLIPGSLLRSGLAKIAATAGPIPLGATGKAVANTANQLLNVWQTTLIVGMALLEGTAFFACIAYLLEAQIYTLAVLGVALGLMLSKFPTQGRLAGWVKEQLDELAMRQPYQ